MFVANWKRSRHRKCPGREMRVVQKWNPNLHGNLSDDHLFFYLAGIEPIVSPKRISAPECSYFSPLLWNLKKAVFSTAVFQEPISHRWPPIRSILKCDKFENGWRLYTAITWNETHSRTWETSFSFWSHWKWLGSKCIKKYSRRNKHIHICIMLIYHFVYGNLSFVLLL